MPCCTIFKMHDVYSVCFVITDLRSLTITCNIYIHMCYKCLACESKMASIFNSGQFSGLPTELPTISLLESSGMPTELPTELPTISVYGCSGQPYNVFTFQNSHGQPFAGPFGNLPNIVDYAHRPASRLSGRTTHP